jgi:hypothetical protein
VRNLLFLLTLLLAFATIAKVVRLKGKTQAVAYEVRQLREQVADMGNENAYRRADVARRTTLQALSLRAEGVGLELGIDGVINLEVSIVDAGEFGWSAN